jgi:hypothetical protein
MWREVPVNDLLVTGQQNPHRAEKFINFILPSTGPFLGEWVAATHRDSCLRRRLSTRGPRGGPRLDCSPNCGVYCVKFMRSRFRPIRFTDTNKFHHSLHSYDNKDLPPIELSFDALAYIAEEGGLPGRGGAKEIDVSP